MLDLKLVHYARTLGQHRNFGRAAEALDLSQPALSRSIARLEAELGVRLFDRTRQGVEPTAFGERFLERGAQLLVEATRLEREISQTRDSEGGVLRVGAGPYAADMSVGPALGRLMARYPRLRIELQTGDWRDIVRGLLQGELDLAVVELSTIERDSKLVTEPLPGHPAVFVCRVGHPLSSEEDPTLERVLEFPLVAPKLPPRVGAMFHRLAKAWAIDPDTGDFLPPIKADTFSLARAVLLTSDAIAIVPLGMLDAATHDGRIAALKLRVPWLKSAYGFAYPTDSPLSAACRTFIAEVRACEAQLTEAESRAAGG